ncbi:MAG: hypothetical protein WC262_10135 [Bacteroidales bacterium]|jgi:hypothetical protein
MAINIDAFKNAKDHGEELYATHSSARAIHKKIDEMINMKWSGQPDVQNVKVTISPSVRNQFMGAVRILTSTDPQINVPHDKNSAQSIAMAENIEKICKAVWYHSGRLLQKPVHYDLTNALLRYGQFHLAVTDTTDLLEHYRNGMTNKATLARYERIAKYTPFLFTPIDPKTGSAQFDAYGLTAYYRQTETTYGNIRSMFGDRESYATKKATEVVTYKEYWSLEHHFTWIDAEDIPFIGADNNGEHGLPIIPIVVQSAEGVAFEKDPELKSQSFLYGVQKSEMWERLNLINTLNFTNLFAYAMQPAFVHEKGEQDSEIVPDFSVAGGVLHLNPGDKFGPMKREVINQDIMFSKQMLDQQIEESTMYKQALGGGDPGNAAFSTIALLSQSGRLPLIAPQRCGGAGIGQAFETMFALMKDNPTKRTYLSEHGLEQIKTAEIPDDLIIDVKLEADLPQDKLQMANVAAIMKQNSFVSDEWIRENILGIGQSDDMTKKIVEERFADMRIEEYFTGAMRQEIELQIQQQMAQQMAQQQQMMQQPPMPQGMPQGAMPPGMPPGGMPQDIQFDPAMGGMPPVVGKGAIPASRPNMKPTSANGEPQGIQEGEM